MTDELYINGTRVDMGEDSGVYLDYESGILSSLDTISANYSYTIKLPKTATNMAVIGGLFFPTTQSEFPSAKNVASLFRDGVPIVQGATLNLLAVNDDEVQVTISWGVAEQLESVSDLSIRNMYGGSERLSWTGDEPTLALMSDMRQGLYNAPIVEVSDILGRIKESAGNVLDYDESVFDNWVVPVLYRERNGTSNLYGHLTGYAVLYNNTGTLSHVNLWFQRIGGDGEIETYGGGMIGEIGCVAGFYPNWSGTDPKSYKLKVFLRFEYDRTSAGGADPSVLKVARGDDSTNRVWSLLEMKPIRDLSDTSKEVYIYEGTFTFSSDDGYSAINYLCFASDSAPYLTQILENNVYGIMVVDADDEDGNLAVPTDNMLYIDNLPDITCKDFIKGVCGLFGMFPQLVGDKVYLTRYNELQAHSYGIYDWSDKLLQSVDVPQEMSISPDGVARANRFTFANDDEYPETAGVIEVADQSLDESIDFITSPFNACPNSTGGTGGVANIPLYSLENADNYDRGQVWDYEEDDGCYILYNDGEYLYFRRFSYMLSEYYKNMASLMAGRVITEHFALDVVDLKDLDMRKVVYLRQYGTYFAIMEVKTKSNYSEVQLLTIGG